MFSLFGCVLKALMALFVLASKDGWVNIMYTGLDAVGVDQQVGTDMPLNSNDKQSLHIYMW